MLHELLLDNPILTRHLRARLRPRILLPLMAAVVIIALCITWNGFSGAMSDNGQYQQAFQTAFTSLLIMQGIILLLLGSSQAASSVSQARESGMMDFHRISPLKPAVLVAGFLFGAPIREYILFACTLPFYLAISLGDPVLAPMMFFVLVDLLIVAVLFHAMGLLLGLAAPASTSSGVMMVVLVLGIHGAWLLPPFTFLSVIPTAASFEMNHMGSSFREASFFGHAVSPIALSLWHQLPLLAFFLVCAARKMRHERAYALARPVAVACYAFLAATILGDLYHPLSTSFMADFGGDTPVPLLLYSLVLLGIALIAVMTPGFGDLLKGIRHAKKLRQPRVPYWGDLAANWAPLGAMAGILVLTGMAAIWDIAVQPYFQPSYGVPYASISAFDTATHYLAAPLIAAGMLIVFGCLQQAFAILFRKHYAPFFGLALFLLLAAPLLFGVLAGLTGAGQEFINGVLALSPLAGIQYGVTDIGYTTITFLVLIPTVVIVIAIYLFAFRVLRRQVTTPVHPPEAVPAPKPPVSTLAG